MDDQPNSPDREDSVTERAASMDPRPSEPQAEGQQDDIEGAGYPTEDMDDVDPEEDLGDDEEGYQLDDDPEGLETGDGMLEELMTPPGGRDLGGDRDTDPNLNGGHGIRMDAPEEGPVPIENEPTDMSIIGHGHEDKAAWNRERVHHLQDLEVGEPAPATAAQMGAGGAVLGGVMEGWEGGMASPAVEQGDDEFDLELSEEEEILGDQRLGDMADVLDDESIDDPDNAPFLPEHRELPDDNIDIEERLVASPGEDSLSAGAELGVNEDLEMEDLNETDNISQAFEDQREGLNDSMDGNERHGGVED